ncbi:hypothetical protein, partial [Vibrio parahaemolyticus]|uniref:hypothetical protein n=1 Tax=Vibrio parahaemolyticus TaxID=670 RepID=UPI001120903A
ELTTPEKTSFQQVNKLLNQQTHRADLQPKTDFRLPSSITTKERNNRLENLEPMKLSFDRRRWNYESNNQ